MTIDLRLRLLLAVLLATFAACAVDDGVGTTTQAASPTTAAPRLTTTSPPPTSSPSGPGDEAPCLAGTTPFVGEGIVTTLGEEPGDATQVAGVGWAAHAGCERVVIDFLTATGAPASALGRTVVEASPSQGIVRVTLAPIVTMTGVSDALIDGELAQRAFLVRQPGGGLAVELHTGASVPVEVRATILDSPVRLAIDVRPAARGGPLLVAPPSVADNVVLISPTSGPNRYPLTVTGYARTFEANVVVRLIAGGEVAVERVTTATDWLDAWGAFSLTVDDGPTGTVELFVGEDSARDGTPQGVVVTLELP